MKRILILSLIAAFAAVSQAQTVPRFARYDVAGTGCKVYLPADPGGFEMTLSEDSSEVYTAEVQDPDGFNFAVIVVKFSEPLSDDDDEKTDMMTSYLDFLQEQFSISGAAGYGKGHTMENAPEAVGVIDYWEDEDGLQYAVKSWCDGKFLAVMMLYGSEEYPLYNAQDMFLNGFRFP